MCRLLCFWTNTNYMAHMSGGDRHILRLRKSGSLNLSGFSSVFLFKVSVLSSVFHQCEHILEILQHVHTKDLYRFIYFWVLFTLFTLFSCSTIVNDWQKIMIDFYPLENHLFVGLLWADWEIEIDKKNRRAFLGNTASKLTKLYF